jgi:hypothetical protein
MVVLAEAITAAFHGLPCAVSRAIMRYFAAHRFLTWCLALLLLAGPFSSAALDRFMPLGGSAPAMAAHDSDPAKILRPQHLWDSLLRPARADAKDMGTGDADPPWIGGDRVTHSHHLRQMARHRPALFSNRWQPRAHPGRPRAPPTV